MKPNAGLLEKVGVHITEDIGKELKKQVEAMSQILESIGGGKSEMEAAARSGDFTRLMASTNHWEK